MYGQYGQYGQQYMNPYNQQSQRLAQLEQQYQQYQQPTYNNYGNMMNNQIQMLKGRPVSSRDEAMASMIDMDGSLFVFTDIANKRIYTKQIMLDGSADFKEYILMEQKQNIQSQNNNDRNDGYVLRSEFNQALRDIESRFMEVNGYESDATINATGTK